MTNAVTLTSPAQITVSATVMGNQISVNASGGTGTYFYSIDGVNFQSSNVFPNLQSGQYTILVKDTNGCSKFENATISNILGAEVTVTAASCVGSADGKLTVTNIDGGISPYSYSINGNDFQSSNQLTNLVAGTYSVYVKDSSGAGKEIGTYTIDDGPVLTLSTIADQETITATGQGGTGVLMYSCLLYTSPSPRDATLSRMPSSA